MPPTGSCIVFEIGPHNCRHAGNWLIQFSKVTHEFSESHVLVEIPKKGDGGRLPYLVAHHTSKPLLLLSTALYIYVLDAKSGGVWQTISLHTPSEELSFVSVFADTMIVISRTTNTTSGEKECFYSHSLL